LKIAIKILLVLILLFVVTIGLSIYVILGVPNGIINDLTKKNARGTIYRIEGGQACLFKVSIQQFNDTIELPVMDCCSSAKIEFLKFVEIGDSIIKEEGKFSLLVIKGKTREVKEFPYPYCFQ
jgi:hypothetical protein